MSKPRVIDLIDRRTKYLTLFGGICLVAAFAAAAVGGQQVSSVTLLWCLSVLGGGCSILASGIVVYRRAQHFVRIWTEKRLERVELALHSALEAKSKALTEECNRIELRVQREVRDDIRVALREERDRVEVQLRKEFQDELTLLEARLREDHLHATLSFAMRTGSCEGLFSREDLGILSRKFSQYDCLTVHWLLTSHDALDILSLTARRNLATELRGWGYLEKSLQVFGSVVELTQTDRDKEALKYRTAELDVYSGRYRSQLEGRAEHIVPVPGHILHIVARALPRVQSGYTLRTHYTAKSQQASGLKVSVVSQVGEAPETTSRECTAVDDIAYFSLPGQPKNRLPWDAWLDQNIAELVSLVRDIRPSVLHAHSDFFNAICAKVVGNYFDLPVVYESRGFWEESWLSRIAQRFQIDWDALSQRWGLPEAYTLRKLREEESRAGADRVFTLAKVMKTRIVEAGVDPSRVSLVPNAVSSDNFPVLTRDPEIAGKLGVDDSHVTIGYVSSIVEYEGIDILIEGFRILTEQSRVPLKLLIVGDGPVLGDLKRLVEDGEIANVIFAGRVSHSEVLSYYSMIDIFVVPRRPVAVCELVTPLKPFEAFSTGRTVVMSDVAALREIADDSQAAVTFRAGDAASLAAVLGTLVADPAKRAALATRGAQWVRERRTWSANCDVYLDVYQELMQDTVPS